MIGPVIKSSFNTLLSLQEVMPFNKVARPLLTLEQNSPAVKNKLDSVMGRLYQLRSAEDDNEHERWVKLFK